MAARVLFISSFIGQNYSGGSVAAVNNLNLCKRLFDGFEVDAYGFELKEEPVAKGISYLPSNTSAVSTFINYTFGNAGSLTFSNVKKIMAIFKAGRYAAVFLDGSLLGKLAKKIKAISPGTVVISFFHNLERQFFKARLLTHPLWVPLYYSACHNERLSSRYADYIFCFTERDSAGIQKYYGRQASAVLPMVVTDRLNIACAQKHAQRDANCTPQLLFVGSDFFANTQGLTWFAKNIMPHVPAQLTVAGKGMEKYKTALQQYNNITVLGTVENLDELYYKADMVVAPIFTGSGMKVKVAEALMMGKTVAGTGEAWKGYAFDKGIGFVCDTAESFIAGINDIKKKSSRFNAASRQMYEELYSPKAQEEILAPISVTIKSRLTA